MKVLVTGAAGFIGSHVSRQLLKRGDTVIGLDNFDPYYSIIHKKRNLNDLISNFRFKLIEGDLRNESLLNDILSNDKLDCIAHLGGMANNRYSVIHAYLFNQVNVTGSLNIFEASLKHGKPHIVFASTSSVYGNTKQIPFKEEHSAVQPLAPYAASKRAVEVYAHSYCNLWDMTITCVRFFNVYGPHHS